MTFIRLLPVKENYLCRPIFKNASKITSEDIDRAFSLYDLDGNNTIEDEELSGFLKDLMELAQELKSGSSRIKFCLKQAW
ncbi:EF hand [Opisthorchis viverrini]|uniref:EF hand n=1 Tax=Opisthorchis viverrini TaxID=6198 RepID=A0A1S8X5H3_OPIVI|nr:EF hand [Opisthorchis viverrini]